MNYSLLKKPINGLIIAFVSAGLLSACGGGSDDSLSRAPSSVNGDGGLMPKALNTAAESSGPAGEMSDKKQAELSVSEADEQALLADNDDESSDMFSEATDAKLAGLEESGGTKKALIIGGSNAKITPRFVAAIDMVLKKDNSSDLCSGSLIHRQWILTAAHCFNDELKSIKIHLGHNDKRMTDAKYKYTVAKTDGAFDIFVHPKYVPLQMLYDIALIKLDRPVPDDVARPIRLETSATSPTVRGKSASLFYGYGAINTKLDLPFILQELALPEIFTISKCGLLDFLKLTLDQMMCFEGSEGKQTYKGDSGGPAIPINGTTGKSSHRVAGVINGGNRVSPFENVAARVYYYRDWIHKTIGVGCDELQYCYMMFGQRKTQSTYNTSTFRVPENSSRYTSLALTTPLLTLANASTQVSIQLEQQMPDKGWRQVDYMPYSLVPPAGKLQVSHYIPPTSGSPTATNNRVFRWTANFRNSTKPDAYIDVAWEYGYSASFTERRLLGNYWDVGTTLFDGITAMFKRGSGFYSELPDALRDGQILEVKFQKDSITRYARFTVGRTQDRVDLTPDRPDDFNVWTAAVVDPTGKAGRFQVMAEYQKGIQVCSPSLNEVSVKYVMNGGPQLSSLPSSLAEGTKVTVHYTDLSAKKYSGNRDFWIGTNASKKIVFRPGTDVETWATVEPSGCYKFHASLL